MVSAIIPVFNTPAEWLVECIGSLQEQTYPDWEAVILDDGSKEPVADIFARKNINDARIKVQRFEINRGVAAARNAAITLAKGSLLLTLDSDDRLKPHYLEMMLPLLESDHQFDCAICDFSIMNDTSKIWRNTPKRAIDMVYDQWVPGPGVLMRRSLYDRIGGYPEDEAFRIGNEDWDFWLSAVEGELKIAYVPEALYEYRVSASSLSNTKMKSGYYRTVELMYERHHSLITGFGLSERFLFDGYFFSIRRCPQAELAMVLRKAFSLARNGTQLFSVIKAMLIRFAAPIKSFLSPSRT